MTQTRGRGEACGGDGMTRMTRMSDADGPDASTRSESRHGGRGPRTGDSESGRGRQVWDLRRLKTAVAAFGGLDNFFDTTAAVFGPGDEFFATGTSVRRARDGTTQVRAARVRSNWSEVIDRSLINEFTEV